jgi:ATP-binding cassette subfamily F protein 3
LITIENLTKSFGGRLLLDGVSFKLNSKERLGVVGRNGHGKTTLFRLIAGEERPDAGTIIVPRNYRIAYVRQVLNFTEPTILEEGMTALPESEKEHYWKVEKILGGLGFTSGDMQRAPEEFSGGFQVRLNLAKALISEPDLLLLDEPTNYLDITSIRWIQRFLNSWNRELMLITHNRGFMDKVVTHTLGIHRRKVRKIEGDTGKYYVQIAQDEEVYEKTRINDERRRREIEQFITRFRAKARLAGLVQSRIKTIEKLEKRDKLEAIKTLEFSFRARPFAGKQMLRVDDISFSYGGVHPLIENFSIHIGAGDRVGVVGPNGKGKTTLAKTLAGLLQPHTGKIVYHPNVEIGYFEQTHVSHLVPSRTVEEEILHSHPEVDRQTARDVCGAMMFSGDDALKAIGVLSGGEKSRVVLAKLLVTPLNFLLLDEPTNHLDMESCDALLAALDNFDGTVVIVTHNEMFLHALAKRLIVFQNNRIDVFEGSYQEFLDKVGWQEEDARLRPASKTEARGEASKKWSKKDSRRRRSEIIVQRSRLLKPLEVGINRIEKQIESREQELSQLHQAMQQASQQQDGNRISEISRDIHSCQSAIDRLFEELERLSEDYDHQKNEFDRQLAAIDADER